MSKPNIKIKPGAERDTLDVYGPLALNKGTGDHFRVLLGTFYGKAAMTHALMFANVVREKYDVAEISTVEPRSLKEDPV